MQILECLTFRNHMGRDHCDVGRVQGDIMHAIEYIVSRGGVQVLAEFFPGVLDSREKISRAEFGARKEHLRISRLYDV